MQIKEIVQNYFIISRGGCYFFVSACVCYVCMYAQSVWKITIWVESNIW